FGGHGRIEGNPELLVAPEDVERSGRDLRASQILHPAAAGAIENEHVEGLQGAVLDLDDESVSLPDLVMPGTVGGELVEARGLELLRRDLTLGGVQQPDLQGSGQVEATEGKAQRLAVAGVVAENGFRQAGIVPGEADER